MKAALAWFNRANPHDSRIAVVGGRPGFKQYVFYGDDLSNHVQYVARHGPHGAYLPIASEAAQNTCSEGRRSSPSAEEWVQALNDGGYDYAVIGPDQRTQSRCRRSRRSGPTAGRWNQRSRSNDDVSVFRIERSARPGRLHPPVRARAGRPERVAAVGVRT